MPDTDQIGSNPPAQTANPQRVLSDVTSGINSEWRVPPDDREGDREGACEFTDGGEDNCPLWDGHIIDATVPPV
jgi:diadenosine tetraphosphatase ApaH/serine/threonine PP2A family protein phosphatase